MKKNLITIVALSIVVIVIAIFSRGTTNQKATVVESSRATYSFGFEKDLFEKNQNLKVFAEGDSVAELTKGNLKGGDIVTLSSNLQSLFEKAYSGTHGGTLPSETGILTTCSVRDSNGASVIVYVVMTHRDLNGAWSIVFTYGSPEGGMSCASSMVD